VSDHKRAVFVVGGDLSRNLNRGRLSILSLSERYFGAASRIVGRKPFLPGLQTRGIARRMPVMRSARLIIG